ncbi:DNA-directed RNA polymerase sigma-24 subunit RpoE [Cupriavidus necator N-1]|jgi:RNA polymerase sigma-70 factor (ECF subfamily)|uniref:DNA-directed RNA polymerase sigma-24 subunit RpoE n=1 Tax=Cupriavidus necator (strain ATCC 43291 / DSM 13513 / CCUG 52238 / LMG 8453 / N-1) TaxID=1042878 RepID=G0EYP5_CUPNN|nr:MULTISPECIES: RNA polymerase sigma factor [Cupriavidus]AEI78691.1 DNA-directed RNA polymerase sigma-24 subunit RpoE [Cupriavidus necator N-1]KAI3605143.1 putative RNA polymerase sigma factor [Cupriavidus necator H850]MDX6012784.1 RNA polymerase sigma factor [Cupriavidus necator]QUN28135.1 RNA polymerase sigma factor [Cupriavidus sp. KK10]UIF85953.1 RNA polymerase sigma factor [Cupriavidus necator]
MEGFDGQLVALAPRLRRHARGLTGDAALADDLVQDTLERALRYRWRFRLRPGAWWGDGADGLLPWLLTLMHRLRLNTVRRKELVVTTDTLPEVSAPADDPGLRRDLVQALAQLPEAQRAVLLLVSLEQLTYAEAARVLDVPQGTVMSRLARAREQMRRLLDGKAPAAAPAASGKPLQRVK